MKILVVFTGGTISSAMDDGYISPAKQNAYKLLEIYDKTSDVEFETVSPYTVLSENLNADYICRMVNCIKENIDLYDGVIVTHGTDTLQYGAAAISYALGLCNKCVVIVSSNYILTDSRANGYRNFCAAVDFILGKYANGVFVSYANGFNEAYIHRASRLLPHEMYDDCVKSVKNSYFGKFENGVFVKNKEYTELADECEVIEFNCRKKHRTVIMKNVYPGITYDDDLKNASAVILNTYHSGTLCAEDEKFKKFIKRAHENNVAVFLLGGEWENFYASAKDFSQFDICLLKVAAYPAMYIKLLFAPYEGEKLKSFMQKSLGGDIVNL